MDIFRFRIEHREAISDRPECWEVWSNANAYEPIATCLREDRAEDVCKAFSMLYNNAFDRAVAEAIGSKTVRPYSSDIAAAFEVVAALDKMGFMFSMNRRPHSDAATKHTIGWFYSWSTEFQNGPRIGRETAGATIPEAICIAALEALKAEGKETENGS